MGRGGDQVQTSVEGLEKRDLFGPKKVGFSGPTPFNGPSNGFAPITKIMKSKHPIKNRYFCNLLYMYMSFARCHFRAIKSQFSGPTPLAMALEMDLPPIKGEGGSIMKCIYFVPLPYPPPPPLPTAVQSTSYHPPPPRDGGKSITRAIGRKPLIHKIESKSSNDDSVSFFYAAFPLKFRKCL